MAVKTVELSFDTYQNVINGELKSTSETSKGVNPANEENLPEFPVTTQADLDEAVDAARKAQKQWAKLSWEERRQKIVAFGDAVEALKEPLLDILTKEAGKSHIGAQDEFERTRKLFKELTTLVLEDEPTSGTEDFKAVVRYTPVGVGCALVPWNYPLMLAVGKIISALITGNTLIVKPSPYAPYTNIKLVELSRQFFPPGVLQVVTGGHELGPMCTEHPGIDKISFTGSTATGKRVMMSCAKTLKRVTLEMGGNDAAIICEDVDIDAIIPKIAMIAFMHSSQVCMAIKRIYVHKAIYDKFAAALVAFVKTLPVGPGTDPANFIVPLQNKAQYEKVLEYFAEIEQSGLRPLLGGKNEETGPGYYVTPTILSNPPDGSRVVREEAFGPILPLVAWEGDDDAVVERANALELGLGASVWSGDVARAERMARQIEAGSVWVNAHIEVSPKVPFGGHKHSGIGCEWGINGLKGWCNSQSFWTPRA